MLVVPVELEGRGRGAGGGDPGGFALARLGTGDRLRSKAPCPRAGGGEPGGRGTRGACEGRSGGSWDDAVTERARRLFPPARHPDDLTVEADLRDSLAVVVLSSLARRVPGGNTVGAYTLMTQKGCEQQCSSQPRCQPLKPSWRNQPGHEHVCQGFSTSDVYTQTSSSAVYAQQVSAAPNRPVHHVLDIVPLAS